jgi:hypothetical protein
MENPYLIINQKLDQLHADVIKAMQRPEPQQEPETYDLTGLLSFLKTKGLPIKKSGIYKATMNKELKFSKFGRSLIFHKEDVLIWIESKTICKPNPTTEAARNLALQANKKGGN